MIVYFFLIYIIGKTISEPSCREFKDFCLKCNELTNLCVKCENEAFSPNEEGGCSGTKICTIGRNYCEECDDERNLCEKCNVGYFPDENGGCAYTDNCEVSLMGQCVLCKKNFILIGSEDSPKICKSINSVDLIGCESINYKTGYCEICKENLFFNEGDKKCIETENCYESLYNQCISCKLGYYLDQADNRKCKPNSENNLFLHCKETEDGENCSKCEDDYFFDEDKKCVNMNFCLKSINSICNRCIDGYFLAKDGESCTKEKNCQHGDKDTGICKLCSNGFYLDFSDRICKSNREEDDLKYCQYFDGECISCEEGYKLSLNGKCSDTGGCAKSELGLCVECSENYYLGIDHHCSKVEHCIRSVEYSSVNECIECEDNYYYNKNIHFCKLAEGIFENCKMSNWANTICEECKDDYYLLPSDNLCYSNKEDNNLYKCAKTNNMGNKCIKCISGYYLGSIDNKCSTKENCAISEGDKCVLCDEDWYCLDVKKGTCEPNYVIEKEENKIYFNCNRTNEEGTKCEECIEDCTLLDNGLCYNNYNCILEDGQCVGCLNEEGHIPYFCFNENFGCVINYNKNCIKCEDLTHFDFCTECSEGYKLNELGKCIEGFSFS